MTQFHFELQEILDYRKSMQDIAEVALGKALASEKAIQDKIDALDEHCALIKQQTATSKDFTEITRAQDYYTYARNQKIILGEELSKAKEFSNKKRDELKSAMQKVNALEELKKTQHEEYKTALQQEEDNNLDDLITSRQAVP